MNSMWMTTCCTSWLLADWPMQSRSPNSWRLLEPGWRGIGLDSTLAKPSGCGCLVLPDLRLFLHGPEQGCIAQLRIGANSGDPPGFSTGSICLLLVLVLGLRGPPHSHSFLGHLARGAFIAALGGTCSPQNLQLLWNAVAEAAMHKPSCTHIIPLHCEWSWLLILDKFQAAELLNPYMA